MDVQLAHACMWASMEPGHEDREYAYFSDTETYAGCSPQWSPVMKTGNTRESFGGGLHPQRPQWSPVMKTGNTTLWVPPDLRLTAPQWSPVMKTGNTRVIAQPSR